jgi:peptidoglycan/LPS O-acetylase OafA/YrhL
MGLTKVYFPGLNGLRFLAASAVVITHIELVKKFLGYNTLWIDPKTSMNSMAITHIVKGDFHWFSPIAAEAGPLGVVFFFVLSGFLITYLLFVEKENTGRISAKQFYLRRIFRIWPLYYLVFILGFFVLPYFDWFHIPQQSAHFEKNFWGNFWCYLLIFPNLALAMFTAVPNIGQAWSIGVEEQFYIVWPLIMKAFKKPLLAIILATGILLSIKALVLFASQGTESEWLIVIRKFLAMSKIECMTIGALGAWLLYYKKEQFFKFIYHPLAQIGAVLGIATVLYCTPPLVQDVNHIAYGLLFIVIILNVSCNKKSFLKLENPLFNSLGQVSYGIYMFHLIVVTFVIYFVGWLKGDGSMFTLTDQILIYSLSLVGTITLSWFSYHLFESRFIRLKSKFSTVISGDMAKK